MITSLPYSLDRRLNPAQRTAQHRHVLGGQNRKADPATGQVLLLAQLLIDRDQHLEACGLRCAQEFAVFEFFPTTLSG